MNYCIDIRNYCLDLLGAQDETHMEWLSAICAAAEQELRARLRSEVDLSEISETFIIAGSLLSISMMRQLDDPGLADFTAATVKLTFSEDRSQLAQAAYRMIEPWCTDAFAFRGVSS